MKNRLRSERDRLRTQSFVQNYSSDKKGINFWDDRQDGGAGDVNGNKNG